MAVQETHITDTHVNTLHTLHRNLHIINSPLPENPTGAAGVAIIFNKLLTNWQSVSHKVLIPGRAVIAKLEWHAGDNITILAVYAPTAPAENKQFWKSLRTEARKFREEFPSPDVLLGDLNFVEDAIDRFPTKLNPIDRPQGFLELRRAWHLVDGWRETFPAKVEWSWRNRSRTSMSRIDRIYVTEELLAASRQWEITISSLNESDHSRVLAELVHTQTPESGPGRWAMDAQLVQDNKFMDEAERIGAKATSEMLAIHQRDDGSNAQLIWAQMKASIVSIAKKRQREMRCTLQSKIATKMKERDRIKEE
ncbi:DNase I-like protein, partial [Auricularia subglabra TFB-10046 SS5]